MTKRYTLFCYVARAKRQRISLIQSLIEEHQVDKETAEAIVNQGKVLKFPADDRSSLEEIAKQFTAIGFDTYFSEP